MNYAVLIVDDEPGITEGLKFLIERYLPECRVVGVAYDGKQGYETAMELQPDLVLSDIRMPGMDGIEMIEQLKKSGYCGRFIILSGYAEFEYARSAIRLGVEEYITKPVDEEELVSVFSRACCSIKEEREKERKAVQMADDLETYSQNMKGYILKDILLNPSLGKIEIREKLEKLTFPLNCGQYGCAVFEIGVENLRDKQNDFFLIMEETARKCLVFSRNDILIPYSDHQAALLTAHEKNVEYETYLNALGRLRREVSDRLKVCVSAGAGLLHHRAEEIRKAFEEARCALNYKVIKGNGFVISYENIRDLTGKPGLIEENDIKQLETCIDLMDDVGCRQVIEAVFRKIEKEKDLSLTDLQLLSLNLILAGIRKMPFMQFQLNEYLGRNILSLESISKFQTIEQLKNWIINTLKSMNELMLKETMPEKKDVIEEAKEYMNRNFTREISLNDISERFFINPYYFSQLFKKKTGETYQSYLTSLRISRAKKLLEETDLKIYEVCSMVGYSDTNHFNKVFERIAGIKPSEYKKNLRI